MMLMLLSIVVSSFKPLVSSVQSGVCTFNKKYHYLSYILDMIYGLIITAVPFILISVFNCLIVHRLIMTRRRHKKVRFKCQESSIVKLEFTFILLLISSCFIVLNMPYFIVWCMRILVEARAFYHGESESEGAIRLENMFYVSSTHATEYNPLHLIRIKALLYITKTIFSCNYCVNFFLYSLTGAYFRRQLRFLCLRRGTSPQNVLHFSKTLASDVTKISLHRTHKDNKMHISPRASHNSSFV